MTLDYITRLRDLGGAIEREEDLSAEEVHKRRIERLIKKAGWTDEDGGCVSPDERDATLTKNLRGAS